MKIVNWISFNSRYSSFTQGLFQYFERDILFERGCSIYFYYRPPA